MPHPALPGLERYRPLVEDWTAFAESLEAPLPGCVWANRLRIAPASFAELLRAEGLRPEPLAWRPGAFRLPLEVKPGNHWWYLAGLGHSQEEVSQLPVSLLDPQPGERVLDLCAAPGGKSAQIVQAMDNRGTLVANDALVGRVRALRANLERLGALNASATVYDGSNYPGAAGRFDRVLVDAPCSGEGMLRKQAAPPGSLGNQRLYQRFARQQLGLLRRAFALCRPGGRIVYSTCTFAPEENELVLDRLLGEADGALRLLDLDCPGFLTRPGITAWQGQRLDPSLARAHRVWPQLNDSGGFFVAVLEKAADARAPEGEGEPVEAEAAPELASAVWDRFAIDSAIGADWLVAARTHRGLYLTQRGHRPPALPRPEALGLRLIRHRLRPPKLSTAGALLLGPRARINFIELRRDQVSPYLQRREQTLGPAQTEVCTGRGFVLVRHLGFGLGIGWYDPAGRRLESLFPKRWMGGQCVL